MRCGRERHVHGHLLVAPAGAYATVAVVSCRSIVHRQFERCAMQFHASTLEKISSTLSPMEEALSAMNDAHFSILRSCPLVCLSTVATRSLVTLAPLPVLTGVQFCVVPLQLGSTGHQVVPQNSVRPCESTILKTLGSVKHGRPSPPNQKVAEGVFCQAPPTSAFRPLHGRRSRLCARYLFSPAYTDVQPRLLSPYRSRVVGFASRASVHCDGPPRHHCLKRERQHCFLLPLPYFSRPSSPSFPYSWPGTAPFSLLSFDVTGKILPRWRLAIAQEAARGTCPRFRFAMFADCCHTALS